MIISKKSLILAAPCWQNGAKNWDLPFVDATIASQVLMMQDLGMTNDFLIKIFNKSKTFKFDSWYWYIHLLPLKVMVSRP